MSDTPADPNPDPKRAPRIPGPRKNLEKPPEAPNWQSMWWYIPVMLLLLWVWQDQLHQMSVKTIPYSQFKQYLAAGEVAECKVEDLEITGRIVPKRASVRRRPSPRRAKAAEAKPVASPDESSHSAAPANHLPSDRPIKAGVSSNRHPARHSPAARIQRKEKNRGAKRQRTKEDESGKRTDDQRDNNKKQEETKPFLFRTERVEPDPQLVEQLEAAKVTFSGVRPSFLSQFLYAWVLPIGVMVVIWVVLSRGLRTAGQSVMSFGKSRARLVADRDTGVTFDDVAGCDEAKYELQEVVDFLKNPSRYIALGAKIPKGVLLVGLPGTGKDAACRARLPARPGSLSSR